VGVWDHGNTEGAGPGKLQRHQMSELRIQNGENLAAYSEIGVAHVSAFDDLGKIECQTAKRCGVILRRALVTSHVVDVLTGDEASHPLVQENAFHAVGIEAVDVQQTVVRTG
jgi:hypothetical protein